MTDPTTDIIEWTRRALAVLTADSVDSDLRSAMFAEMVAAPDEYDEREAALAYATGMGNVAKILLGQVALERGITRAEACQLLSQIITEIEADLRGAT